MKHRRLLRNDRLKYIISIFLAIFFLANRLSAQISWWEPNDPDPGDEVTIFYNTIEGTIPVSASQLNLHWGVNQTGAGNWAQPPNEIWPDGTIDWGDGAAVQSPMNNEGDGIWRISIQTTDSIRTIHFVCTDGSNWDNNNGQNWDIELNPLPEPPKTWHTFIYDSRSSYSLHDTSAINSIHLAGIFNNWSSSADRMLGPDEKGVYLLDRRIPIGETAYKFVINGNTWIADPDNPLNDGSQYGNSFISLAQRDKPSFWHMKPFEGSIFQPGDTISLEGIIRPADTAGDLSGAAEVRAFGSAHNLSFDTTSGLIVPSRMIVPPNIEEGNYLLEISVQDYLGQTSEHSINLGVFRAGSGFHFIDATGDDNGNGEYLKPDDSLSADLLSFHITSNEYGDSIQFELVYGEGSLSYTKTLLLISSQVDALPTEQPYSDIELHLPDWNGAGVQILLTDPTSTVYDSNINNRLIFSREPPLVSSEIDVEFDTESSTVSFNLALDDLESILGKYNKGWYFASLTYLAGINGTFEDFEIDSLLGGINDEHDPDVYDLIFVDSNETQKRLLANHSPNRSAVLDAVGRGFAYIEPTDIGPDIGSSAPEIRFLSRGGETVITEWGLHGLIDTDHLVDIFIQQEYPAGDTTYLVPSVDDTFQTTILLREGVNTFRAEANIGNETTHSSKLRFTLYVEHTPQVYFKNYIDNDIIHLDASNSFDPQNDELTFRWIAETSNPSLLRLSGQSESILSFPTPNVSGEYNFELYILDSDGNIGYGKTSAFVHDDSVDVFNINEAAPWVMNAIVYEIFVRSYSSQRSLDAVTADLERIKNLGFNTIWLMPINPGPTDHGYEIVDYYGIEEDYGTPDGFRELVNKAHELDLKVILDLVINHSSINHPFMREAIRFGKHSPYWDWYDRNARGDHTYYYDWHNLPNLNFDNPDVWREFINMSLWWVEEYDIDGYRCDVAWGPQQRNSAFWKEWRRALKTRKPGLMLLGEASSSDWGILEERFDIAYDWSLHHEGNASFANIFNGFPSINNLHSLVTNYNVGWPPYKTAFRFIENHDEQRYIDFNSVRETKLASTLLFNIPGVPMVYAGQEIGIKSQRGSIDWSSDPDSILQHYMKIIAARRDLPALRTGELVLLEDNQTFVYAIGRYLPSENTVFSVYNFMNNPLQARVLLPVDDWNITPDSTYLVFDILEEDSSYYEGHELDTLNVFLLNQSAAMFMIADSSQPVDAIIPETFEFSLEQNYPNPFNHVSIIPYSLAEASSVSISIYDTNGRLVNSVFDGIKGAGNHQLVLTSDEFSLPSGVYIYKLETSKFTQSRKLVLLR